MQHKVSALYCLASSEAMEVPTRDGCSGSCSALASTFGVDGGRRHGSDRRRVPRRPTMSTVAMTPNTKSKSPLATPTVIRVVISQWAMFRSRAIRTWNIGALEGNWKMATETLEGDWNNRWKLEHCKETGKLELEYWKTGRKLVNGNCNIGRKSELWKETGTMENGNWNTGTLQGKWQ